jgi:predicted anti-sigma-YlaC factor YlaD
MTRNEHERAQELIALAGVGSPSAEIPSGKEQAWLRTHLQACAICRDYQKAAGRVVRELRAQPLAAGSALVRATQMRVRQRGLELQHQQERLWVICVCSIAVTLATAVTTAALWRGFAWMGEQAQLPAPAWQIGLVTFGFLPAIVAGFLLLARGTYLADHNGSFRNGTNQG